MDLFGFRKKYTPQGVGQGRRLLWWPWNLVWLVFSSWVISYANEWEDHSNNWEQPRSWSFDSDLELFWHFWVCHLACRLRIKV